MKPSMVGHAILAFVIFLSACNREPPKMPLKPLNPQQQQIVGEWILLKVVERGSVSRELVFHADGTSFTTICRSIFDDAVAEGKGEGKWTVVDGIVKAKWVEQQTVGKHTQNIDYELTLRIDSKNGETTLIVSDNQDAYKRK